MLRWSRCFDPLPRSRRCISPALGKFENRVRSATHPYAATSGSRGICEKPRVKCSECPNQAFVPVTDDMCYEVIFREGTSRTQSGRVGSWPAFIHSCRMRHAGSSLLISTSKLAAGCCSRSANRAEKKVFLSQLNDRARAMELMPGSSSRNLCRHPTRANLGRYLVTATMDRCPDIGFDSYDRFFPSQDTMPAGGFGNLIALPFQNEPRENGNSVFVDRRASAHTTINGVSCRDCGG